MEVGEEEEEREGGRDAVAQQLEEGFMGLPHTPD